MVSVGVIKHNFLLLKATRAATLRDTSVFSMGLASLDLFLNPPFSDYPSQQ
jgi:hypothetical protein